MGIDKDNKLESPDRTVLTGIQTDKPRKTTAVNDKKIWNDMAILKRPPSNMKEMELPGIQVQV